MNYKFVIYTLSQIFRGYMDDLNSKKIVEVIKDLRLDSKKRLGTEVTPKDMAEALGIGLRQYQKYEAGTSELKLNQFFIICRVLAVSPAELFIIAYPKLGKKENPVLVQKLIDLEKLVKEISEIGKDT